MKTHAQKILNRPIADWQRAVGSTRGAFCGALQDVESELAALIQRATLLHGYVAHRYNTGCGEQAHADSAKHARRELVKVRKALGFSYPKNTPLSIR